MTIKAAKVHDHMLASPVHQLGVTMTAYASSPVIAPGQKVETFRYWRMCAWAGPAFLFVFFVFWGLLGGNIPPIPANSPATTLANHYRGDANLIRIGMGVAMTFVVLYVIWGLAFTKVIERGIERGTDNNVLSTLQLWGAGLTVVPLLIGSAFWLTGSYRPESLDPSILQLYYDMPWLLINLAYSVTTVQMCAMGVAFLKDKRETPLYPRWLSWFGIFVGVSFALELLFPYFKTGPFARQGVINFWVEFFLWFFWIIFATVGVLKAIGRLEAEAALEQQTPGAEVVGRIA
jgi:hypothetical protein